MRERYTESSKPSRSLCESSISIIEQLLSDSETVELIPMRIDDIPAGVQSGIRIMKLTREDTNGDTRRKPVKCARKMKPLDKENIEETLNRGNRVHLIPLEKGFKVMCVKMYNLRIRNHYYC